MIWGFGDLVIWLREEEDKIRKSEVGVEVYRSFQENVFAFLFRRSRV